MKTNKDFRRSGDDSRGGEHVKGKSPFKGKKSKRSIYNEIEEDEDLEYSHFHKRESVEDYFDDYENEHYGNKFDFVDDDYDDEKF
jgi:hypothetical protein